MKKDKPICPSDPHLFDRNVPILERRGGKLLRNTSNLGLLHELMVRAEIEHAAGRLDKGVFSSIRLFCGQTALAFSGEQSPQKEYALKKLAAYGDTFFFKQEMAQELERFTMTAFGHVKFASSMLRVCEASAHENILLALQSNLSEMVLHGLKVHKVHLKNLKEILEPRSQKWIRYLVQAMCPLKVVERHKFDEALLLVPHKKDFLK